MEWLRQYVLSVVCMVTVCGIMQLFFQTGTMSSLVKMVSGLIVTITVLSPLLKDRIPQWDFRMDSLSLEGELAVGEGIFASQQMQKQIIKENMQTYILSKAKDMGADLTVDIQLEADYPNLPRTATVFGTVSPYVKRQLAECMRLELGIAEEDQIWIS